MARKARPLHPEERKLWGHVTRSVRPYAPNKHPPESDWFEPGTPSRAAPVAGGPKSAPQPKPARPAPQNHLDGATERKLKRGRAEIDARLDLHGMRQHEAHDALIRFVMTAQAHGHRCVLVITGKGTRGDSTKQGVLKSRLGQWLHQEPLRSIAYGLREAHARHGGSGAHYVFIRKIRG